MFGIFDKQRKLNKSASPDIKLLDKMWMCVFCFNPWDVERHNVVFKEVGIVKAYAEEGGIFVESNENSPFLTCDYPMSGYIGKFTSQRHWVGFFETKEEAIKAYNDLMKKWVDVIESKIVDSVDT